MYYSNEGKINAEISKEHTSEGIQSVRTVVSLVLILLVSGQDGCYGINQL